MKKTWLLILFIHLLRLESPAQKVNRLLDSLEIYPTTISFHPRGQILISEYKRKTRQRFMYMISQNEQGWQLDTLPVDDPNRAAFSKGGEYIIYNTFDPLSREQYTIKRKFDGKDKFGSPFYLSQQLMLDNMYYYFMDEEENFYYYTFVRKDRSQGGLFLSAFENGRYQKPQQIYPDRENAVAYTPLILDEETMLFTQHGIKDNSTNGTYFALKEGEKWSDPILLEEIPFSNVITYYDEDTVAFLLAETARVKLYPKAELLALIKNQSN